MRNFSETSITQAVIDRIADTTDPRVREISESLIKNLHNFVREVRPTEEEWGSAIEFLTKTGKICDDVRQEFILLSDVLGVSMLVDAINYDAAGGATESTVLGPFYVKDPPVFPNGADLAGKMKGKPLYIDGHVLDTKGNPVANAWVDIWHSDDAGFYDVQQQEVVGGLAGRGRLITDKDGRFWCWTIEPIEYPVPHDGPAGNVLIAQGRHPWRPAHVHFMIGADGFRTLTTHVFVDGNVYIDSDAVFGVKDSLIAKFPDHPPGTAPDGTVQSGHWSTLNFDFKLMKK